MYLPFGLRLGFGVEERSYAATYRGVTAAVAGALVDDPARILRAHSVLRTHGQRICRRSVPQCGECVLADVCAYARARDR